MKKVIIVFVLFFIVTTVNLQANEEMQGIDIFVKNAPNKYYLDILFISDNNNYHNDLSEYDQEIVNKIVTYQDNKYNSSFVKGSELTLIGSLNKINVSKNRNVHSFKYNIFEKEDNYLEANKKRINSFKVVIVTENDIKISDEILITSFNSKIVYDYQENDFKVQPITTNVFSFAIIISLLIFIVDAFILLGFGETLSKNIKKIIILSFVVPLILTSLIGYSFYFDIYGFAVKNLILLTIFIFFVNIICSLLMYKKPKLWIKLLYGLLITIVFFIINYLGLIIIK